MSNNALFTIEQVDNKLIITVEAVKVETVEPEKISLDLSKFKPFPVGYVIPEGTKVISVADDRIESDPDYSKGKTGLTKNNAAIPFVLFDDGNRVRMKSSELAPIDPSDHPDYKQEQPDLPETRPMNADEIEDWVRRSLCTGFNPNKLTEHINQLVQYELNKAKQ